MKNCTVCHKEITPQMIRHGEALSRGAEVFHRACRTGGAPAASGAPARPTGRPASRAGSHAGGVRPSGAPPRPGGTSFPDIPEAVEYASFWRRVGANVLDSFILNVVVTVAMLPLMAMGVFAVGANGEPPTAMTLIVGLIGFVLPVAYYVLFWTRNGATPGKSALGIRVITAGGGPLTGGQSFLRYLGYIPSGLFFGLGYLAMLWDGEKRCWHDRIAGTRVIRV